MKENAKLSNCDVIKEEVNESFKLTESSPNSSPEDTHDANQKVQAERHLSLKDSDCDSNFSFSPTHTPKMESDVSTHSRNDLLLQSQVLYRERVTDVHLSVDDTEPKATTFFDTRIRDVSVPLYTLEDLTSILKAQSTVIIDSVKYTIEFAMQGNTDAHANPTITHRAADFLANANAAATKSSSPWAFEPLFGQAEVDSDDSSSLSGQLTCKENNADIARVSAIQPKIVSPAKVYRPYTDTLNKMTSDQYRQPVVRVYFTKNSSEFEEEEIRIDSTNTAQEDDLQDSFVEGDQEVFSRPGKRMEMVNTDFVTI